MAVTCGVAPEEMVMDLATFATYLVKEMIMPQRNVLTCYHSRVHLQSYQLADEVYVELTSRLCFRVGRKGQVNV